MKKCAKGIQPYINAREAAYVLIGLKQLIDADIDHPRLASVYDKIALKADPQQLKDAVKSIITTHRGFYVEWRDWDPTMSYEQLIRRMPNNKEEW